MVPPGTHKGARKLLRYGFRALPIICLVGFSFVFYYLSPARVIGLIGVENAYALIFILALLGGLTTFSGIPYHVVLVTLATGPLNPFFLGLATSIGVILGDSTSYYVGYQGRFLMSLRMQRMLDRVTSVRERHPRLLPVLFLLYGSLSPFSNDVITIPMGLLRYPFWRVMLPLAIGNLIFNVSLALIAAYAYSVLQVFPFF